MQAFHSIFVFYKKKGTQKAKPHSKKGARIYDQIQLAWPAHVENKKLFRFFNFTVLFLLKNHYYQLF